MNTMSRRTVLSASAVLIMGQFAGFSGKVLGAPATPAGTPAEHQFNWVLAALRPDAPVLTEAELTEHFTPEFLEALSPDQVVATVREFTDVYGSVTLSGLVRPPTDTQVIGLVTAQTGDEFLVTVFVESTEPHPISMLSLQPAPVGISAIVETGGAFGGRFDIGSDRHLYMACTGPDFAEGGPTVVLEAGHGSESTVWLAVQAALAPEIRACVYDRANVTGGTSDPAPIPRTGEDVVTDLNALLNAAGVPGPYVLVGHSLGGLFVRLYASTYPDDVAGLVLVDSSHEDQEERFRTLVEPELWAEYERDTTAFVDPEGLVFADIGAEVSVARSDTPLAPMPLVVLTHGIPLDATHFPSGWPIEKQEMTWQALQVDLVGLVPGGTQVIAKQSGHFIQLDQPELVVEAIRGVVAELDDPNARATPTVK